MANIETRNNRESDIRHNRRMREEVVAVRKMDKQLDAADALIGILNSGTQYINIRSARGIPTGAIKAGTRHDLIAYLIRNKYV